MTRSQTPALRWLLSLVAMLTLGLAGLAVVGPGPARAQEQAVAIVDFAFDPAQIEVAAGTTVTWTNQGAAPHTATADDGSFDSGRLDSGASFSFTFDTPGTFTYHCEIHPNMTAAIVVTEVAAPAAETPAAGGEEATAPAEPAAAAGRPAHIHSGNCDELGDVVQPLTDLTAPTGQEEGQSDLATPAESSFTNVPVPLEQILAEDHAINVHFSAEQIEVYIACGEIGGVRDANGALVIGLRPVGDSGFNGIAFLAPGADGASTDVSVFVAGAEGSEAAMAVSPEAGAAGGTVNVSLTEFMIDMPDTIPAGPTTFNISNDGTVEHGFEVEGQGIEEEIEPTLQPGESGTLEVDLAPGTYEVYCPVGNHRGQGMSLELTVE